MKSKTIHNVSRQAKKVVLFVLLLSFATISFAADKKNTMKPDEAKAKQAYAIGVQAYIWGYPMVVMQKSRDAMTKGGDAPVTPEQFKKTGKLFAPVNQVASAWGMLGPKFSVCSRTSA
jgi:hypothetical protein